MNINKEWLHISYDNDYEPLLTFSLSHSDRAARLTFFKEEFEEELGNLSYLFDEDFLETDAFELWEENGDCEDYDSWYFNIHTGEIKQVAITVRSVTISL